MTTFSDSNMAVNQFTVAEGQHKRRPDVVVFGRTALDQAEAVAVMLEKYEICLGLYHGFDWSLWRSGTAQERLALLPAVLEQAEVLSEMWAGAEGS